MARLRYHQQRVPVLTRQMQGGMDQTTAMPAMAAPIQTEDTKTRRITINPVRPAHTHTDRRRRNPEQCTRGVLQAVGDHRLDTTVGEAILVIGRQGNMEDHVSRPLGTYLEQSLTGPKRAVVLRLAHPSTIRFPPSRPETFEIGAALRHAV